MLAGFQGFLGSTLKKRFFRIQKCFGLKDVAWNTQRDDITTIIFSFSLLGSKKYLFLCAFENVYI